MLVRCFNWFFAMSCALEVPTLYLLFDSDVVDVVVLDVPLLVTKMDAVFVHTFLCSAGI
jgi:hypothetical protein